MAGRLRDATAVAVVSLRRQTVTAAVSLPSRWAHIHFRIEAGYDCQVVDAELLLACGRWDVRPDLQRYLSEDPEVHALVASADPFDGEDLQLRLAAHVMARSRECPPFVPGLVCDLVSITAAARQGPAEAVFAADGQGNGNGDGDGDGDGRNGGLNGHDKGGLDGSAQDYLEY